MSDKFKRDPRSKALINTDESILGKRKILREKMKQQEEFGKRISSLEEELFSLKELVKKLINEVSE